MQGEKKLGDLEAEVVRLTLELDEAQEALRVAPVDAEILFSREKVCEAERERVAEMVDGMIADAEQKLQAIRGPDDVWDFLAREQIDAYKTVRDAIRGMFDAVDDSPVFVSHPQGQQCPLCEARSTNQPWEERRRLADFIDARAGRINDPQLADHWRGVAALIRVMTDDAEAVSHFETGALQTWQHRVSDIARLETENAELRAQLEHYDEGSPVTLPLPQDL